ncbi:MAG: SDR family NAD(P)-dependent oxidoreductase [Candidatus Lokiarchaeota archaeon]|nr:SDR family NAD(P)-dependent oxidoreductase [Candidatus Harpocratesius repetitus]
MKLNKLGQNDYALITGASAGIGRAFAEKLASLGLNIILVARREKILNDLRISLEKQYGIHVDVIMADLTQKDGIIAVKQKIMETNSLALLINAAGFGTLGKFNHLDEKKMEALHTIHTTTPLILTHAALQILLKREQGAIINISSMEIFRPPKIGIVYSASKQYISTLTLGIRRQLRNMGASNIQMHVVYPGYTRTEFHHVGDYIGKRPFKKPKFLWTTPDQVVSATLKAVEKNKGKIIPGWINKMIRFIFGIPGVWWILKIFG